MARIVLQGFGARMATFDGGKSELAGATLERVLTAGVYDRRWHALVPYLGRLSRAGSMCGALSTSTVGAYVRLVPCVDGSELARTFFTPAGWSVQPCVRPFDAVHMTAGQVPVKTAHSKMRWH